MLQAIPLRRLRHLSTRAIARPDRQRRAPLRFCALRMRCGEARWRMGRMLFAPRRHPAQAQALNVELARSTHQWPGGRDDRCNRFIATRRVRHIKRLRISHSPVRPRSCTVALLWRGVPLPTRTLRGLARPSGPSLVSVRQRSWGFHQRPSQVCSRIGWTIISDRPGPRACSSERAPRLIFVG